jgi:hypothetical protein
MKQYENQHYYFFTTSDFGIKIFLKQSMTIYDNGMQLSCYVTMLLTAGVKNCTSYEAFDKCETPTLTSHPKSDLLCNMKSLCVHFSDGSVTNLSG